jgi:hypothetical protein
MNTLERLDSLRLECDGMTRVISTLLNRDGVAHTVRCGRVRGPGDGIDLHYWVVLTDGRIVDLRARVWLGDDAPHGVFKPDQDYEYITRRNLGLSFVCSSFVFFALTCESMNYFEPITL